MNKLMIVKEILDYVQNCGGYYSSWYVGISMDARNRLFVEHRVSKEFDSWVYCPAESSTDARELEKYFLEVVGADGSAGGGNRLSNMVYAYKKSGGTRP